MAALNQSPQSGNLAPGAVGPPKPKSNIFATTLKSKEGETAEFKKLNYRGGFIRLIIAAAFLGTYSVMFFYPQLQEYLVFEDKIHAKEEVIQEKETILESLEKERNFHKAAYDEEFEEEQRVIDAILPDEDDKLGVIRLMENFATHLSTTYPPFDFTAISFQAVKQADGYKVLPFSTTIHASRANFERFLGLVNLSGSLDLEADDHIRLIEISNISIRYLGVDKTGKDKGVDFTVTMSAYSK